MSIPLSAFFLILILLIGATFAMGAFIWAVRHKQFKDLNDAAYVIFDEEEPIGKITEDTFRESREENNSEREP